MPRRVRKFVCAATAMLVCAVPAEPAEPTDDSQSLSGWVVRAQERLSLKPAQQRDLRMLVDLNSGKLRDIQVRYKDSTSEHARTAQLQDMQALRVEFRDELAGILTPDQLSQWDALLEELLASVRSQPQLAEVH